MDPAGPSFKGQLLRMRTLNRKDAEFVDVIHTDNTLFGFPRSLGSVDFYPNGAEDPQPGCFIRKYNFSNYLRVTNKLKKKKKMKLKGVE